MYVRHNKAGACQLHMKGISHSPLKLLKCGMYDLAGLKVLSSNYMFSRLAIVHKNTMSGYTDSIFLWKILWLFS